MTKYQEKLVIESYAYDCTIGAGVAEEFYNKNVLPTTEHFTRLSSLLKREITSKDISLFQSNWKECLMRAVSP